SPAHGWGPAGRCHEMPRCARSRPRSRPGSHPRRSCRTGSWPRRRRSPEGILDLAEDSLVVVGDQRLGSLLVTEPGQLLEQLALLGVDAGRRLDDDLHLEVAPTSAAKPRDATPLDREGVTRLRARSDVELDDRG